jgi:hypothetical protein
MLFTAVYRGSLQEIFSGFFLAAVICATLATAVIGYFVSRRLQNGAPAQSVLRGLNGSLTASGELLAGEHE